MLIRLMGLRTLRLAVLGTPRSGNTWLRRMLATAYRLDGPDRERAIQDASTIDWGSLPDRSITQVHVAKTYQLAQQLSDAGVRVIVPIRHPLDVLISILQYARGQLWYSTRWIQGVGGDESEIVGRTPCDPKFLEYAVGPRARALLDVSRSWIDEPGTIFVRYENLVEGPLPILHEVARKLGARPLVSWQVALRRNTMSELRKIHGPGHVWQGRPGLWRSLLTASAVDTLVQGLSDHVDWHGDPPVGDPTLTIDEARARWNVLNP